MADLTGLRVACLATDGFEEAELTEPVKALRDSGATVDVIAPKSGTIQAFKHQTPSIQVNVDRTIQDVKPEEYGAVLLPGGALNADTMRADVDVLGFIKTMNGEGRPFAAICHAPWELVSAGLARGRTMTSYHTIQDDIRNAGATWVDREVVVDGNLVTSRQPGDLPAFIREMSNLFALVPAGQRGV
jgi:protease I